MEERAMIHAQFLVLQNMVLNYYLVYIRACLFFDFFFIVHFFFPKTIASFLFISNFCCVFRQDILFYRKYKIIYCFSNESLAHNPLTANFSSLVFARCFSKLYELGTFWRSDTLAKFFVSHLPRDPIANMSRQGSE